MTDAEIIAIRKATQPANFAVPWADSIAFARAILAEPEKALQMACSITVQIGGEPASERDTLLWRTEMAREYCVKHGILPEGAP